MAIIQGFPQGEQKREVIQSYADSLKIIWVTMAGLAGVALILSVWTEGLDLNRPLETEQGFLRGDSVSTAGGGGGVIREEEMGVRKDKEVAV